MAALYELHLVRCSSELRVAVVQHYWVLTRDRIDLHWPSRLALQGTEQARRGAPRPHQPPCDGAAHRAGGAQVAACGGSAAVRQPCARVEGLLRSETRDFQ